MDPSFLSRVAHAVDRSRRLSISCRVEQQIADVPRGWMCWEPGHSGGDVPSASPNRVHWFTAQSPLTREELGGTLGAIRARDLRRVYFMLNPRGWTERVEHDLNESGASLWPYVRYPVLVRPAAPITPARPCEFSVRSVSAEEAPAILAAGAACYSGGYARAQVMLERGCGEMHAAFEGERPVAFTFLMNLGDGFAYLGSAGTDPAKRGRGAQTALICSRVTAAAEAGCRWCISETNTAVAHSLGNLQRCGFETIFDWRVYSWSETSR
jgi:hypothetical protein